MSNCAFLPLLPKSRPAFWRTLVMLLCCTLPASNGLADERATLRLWTQEFYASYGSAQDAEKFIAKSDKITPGLKKAYAAFMKKQPGFDPIVQGQDMPASGYEAGEVELADETHAVVTMRPREKGFTTLKVSVVWNGKAWLLNGVNDLNAGSASKSPATGKGKSQKAPSAVPKGAERKAILDALRRSAEKDLEQPVLFKVERLRVAEGWARALVAVNKLDFLKTKYRALIELGAFDPQGEALLRFEGDSWKVLEWVFGATDVPSAAWPQKYRLPKVLLE